MKLLFLRYHIVGILVFFVHDVNDILVEFTKCNIYLKNRNSNLSLVHDVLSKIGLCALAITWLFFLSYY